MRFEICTFRARIPNQSRVIYNWHQDEGTWFLSKNKNLQNKFFFNIKIFNLNKAYKNYVKNKNAIILVTHPENKTYLKIRTQIIKEGFPANNIKNIGYKKIFKL